MLQSASIAMLLFSLGMSLSPGPVNVAILSSGAAHGVARTLPFVAGATVGFAVMLSAVGLVLGPILDPRSVVTQCMRWLGTAFILYLSWRIASATPNPDSAQKSRLGWWQGAVVQALNPKAWIACASGTALFAPSGDAASVFTFVLVYGIVCGLSLTLWAFLGEVVSSFLSTPGRFRAFNVFMGLSMAGSALFALST